MELPKPQKPEPTPRTPIPRRTRGPQGKLAEQAEVLWSLIIRKRAGRQCEVPAVGMLPRCPSTGTDAAHFLAKGRYPHVRYDLDNGVCLCRSHHNAFHDATLDGPSPMRTLMIQLRGRPAWDRLAKLCLESSWTDLKLIVSELRAEDRKLREP